MSALETIFVYMNSRTVTYAVIVRTLLFSRRFKVAVATAVAVAVAVMPLLRSAAELKSRNQLAHIYSGYHNKTAQHSIM
jgi:hypothetical protein